MSVCRPLMWMLASGCLVAAETAASAGDDGADRAVSRLLNPSQHEESLSALRELKGALRTAPSETSEALRATLRQWVLPDSPPRTIRLACLALAAGPPDDAIRAITSRFGPATPADTQVAVCRGLRDLIREHRPREPETEDMALQYLATITRSSSYPPRVVDSALLATAACGSKGFERLVQLWNDGEVSRSRTNALYTALGETGDDRALPLLRAAVSDVDTTTGRRIQAIRAIGQLFPAAAKKGAPISPAKREVCVRLLRQYLNDDTPDQLFSVALRSLGRVQRIDDSDALRDDTFGALSTVSDHRREAAMRVLYSGDAVPAEEILRRIRSVLETDPSPVVRDIARAILDKHRAGNAAQP